MDDHELVPANSKCKKISMENSGFCQGKNGIGAHIGNGKFMWKIKVGKMF